MFNTDLLNKSQKEAVECDFGPALVIAGAGTGKTRVLTSRIMYLMQYKNINPNEILSLTFTNKAANEMKKRISDEGFANLSWMGTYSSIALRILRKEIHLLGRNSNFTVIDNEDQESAIKEICKLHNIDHKKITPKRLLSAISTFKNMQYEEVDSLSIDKFKKIDLYTWEDINIFKHVFNLYQKKLIENNFVDFDDLLLLTLKIFDTHSEISEKWQNKFKYVLVDEFQDTNMIQFEILLHLVNKKSPNVFVVGDPDQTIYTWRGAYPNIFKDFMKFYPSYKMYVLDKNYRSTQNILDASNKLIKNNRDRIDKSLMSNSNSGEQVLIYNSYSTDDESNFVAKQIKKNVEKYKYSDMAILYRNNYQSRNIETSLINYGIPYVVYGGVKFYQRKEIKDILSYLRIMVNDDEFSYKRIINIPRRNIGPTTIDNISLYAQKNDIPFVNALYLTNPNEYDLTWAVGKIIPFLNEIKLIKESIKGLSVSQSVKKIIDMIQYIEYLKTIEDDVTQREENIQELISSIINFEKSGEVKTIEEYLDKISLYTTSDEQTNKADSVAMMTIHAAKGLEFKIVYVIGMNEGTLPSLKGGDIEEERRISYVAMTRAQELLYLTSAKGYNPIAQSENITSRFINEIKGPHIKYVRNESSVISDLKQNWYDSHQNESIENRYNESSADINIGDTIIHTAFGEGLVISKKDDFIEIIFKAPYGHKTLNAKHKAIRLKN